MDSIPSVSVLLTTFASIALLKLLTIRSQTPLKCGAPGGFNFHFIGFWATERSLFDWFPAAIHSGISVAEPTKSVPLSLRLLFGALLRAMTLLMAARQESASKLDTVLKLTAIVVKHVNRQHHRFNRIVMNYNSNGPKKSTPVLANGNTFSSSLFFRKICYERLNSSNLLLSPFNTLQLHISEGTSESKHSINLLQNTLDKRYAVLIRRSVLWTVTECSWLLVSKGLCLVVCEFDVTHRISCDPALL